MPFNGSGLFTRVYSWVADASAGILITASRMDTDTNDITANGLNNCLTRDGQGIATANLPMGTFRHTGVGNGVSPTDYAALGQLQLSGKNIQVATGTGTFTVPAAVTAIEVEGWAAGGGSGGSAGAGSGSGAGGGGGYFRKTITGLVPGATIAITVGAQGTAGSSTGPTNGGAGGNVSFGAYASANGGSGGNAANGAVASQAIAGGSATGGDINVTGGSATQPFALAGGVIQGSTGGGAFGVPVVPQGWGTGAGDGGAGPSPGGGASGAINGGTGAAGGPGRIIIRW